MLKVSYYILSDLAKNRFIIALAFLLAIAGWGIFMVESQPQKVIIMLMQISILVLPLITMVFTAGYYYNSQEFIYLILTQPVNRTTVIKSLFTGLITAFALSYFIGMGIPLIFFYPSIESLNLIIISLLLTLIFVSIALMLSTIIRDKARGMGTTLLVWIYFAFLYDGFLLFFMYQFGDYPIEKVVLAFTFGNPIDIARLSIVMKTEISALLGLTGAVFKNFFGNNTGFSASLAAMILWTFIPLGLAIRNFRKKDM